MFHIQLHRARRRHAAALAEAIVGQGRGLVPDQHQRFHPRRRKQAARDEIEALERVIAPNTLLVA